MVSLEGATKIHSRLYKLDDKILENKMLDCAMLILSDLKKKKKKNLLQSPPSRNHVLVRAPLRYHRMENTV